MPAGVAGTGGAASPSHPGRPLIAAVLPAPRSAREEEVGVSEDYLARLHYMHESWLFTGARQLQSGGPSGPAIYEAASRELGGLWQRAAGALAAGSGDTQHGNRLA